MKKYFYNMLFKYLSLFVFENDSVLIINPSNNLFSEKIKLKKIYFTTENTIFEKGIDDLFIEDGHERDFNYIIVNGSIHYERDVNTLLKRLRQFCSNNTRIIITYYSALWRPLISLATLLKIRTPAVEENWVAPEDITNFLLLADFEEIHKESRIIIPIYIPLISNFFNRFIAPLPIFNLCNLLNISISRKIPKHPVFETKPSVSVIVAARNEEGNIDGIIRRLPAMGPDDELIFVEGNSQDDTWHKIKQAAEENRSSLNILTVQQTGTGKGDAVRKGFSLASKEILMILDADLTVPPENLPEFYEAIVSGKGEYINGSRLVYPMEKEAMRFFNILGNKFFALAFSFVLGQRFKDTLCGTKVLTRENYLRLADHRHYFGDFDPFGDFDLIFGSARLGLKIVEVPIRYRERTYGDTNISRWRHGLILLRMLFFAARKIKFI
jgi:hypothetical protein